MHRFSHHTRYLLHAPPHLHCRSDKYTTPTHLRVASGLHYFCHADFGTYRTPRGYLSAACRLRIAYLPLFCLRILRPSAYTAYTTVVLPFTGIPPLFYAAFSCYYYTAHTTFT